MTDSQDDLVGYRLERAADALEDARILAQAKRWDACMSRL